VAVMGPSSDKQGSTGAKAETVIRAANPAKSSSGENRANIDPKMDHKLQDLVSSPEGRREVALTLTFNPDFSFLFASNLEASSSARGQHASSQPSHELVLSVSAF
jgi:hypothetical protein